ncbi:hypothetical protein J2Z40_000555 [Cytobacillus eiseniae]|uniref:Coat protein YlbD-like n=1 Tax=Cytobacillus eiseniae TaxID=762947 RepID=A0ABS4RDU3_9BACI|nr:YlbD family protein [Cytobacillus eiseniae]MBP2240002.1 hypothetical protein [Cytobacillus eiseniae]
MVKKNLHPSVEQFKSFVKANPKIVKEVRSGKNTWQELYEDWYLLGEDDSRWDAYRMESKQEAKTEANAGENKTDWLGTILGAMKKMDPNEMQGYVQNISQALGTVQGVLAQFQGGSGSTVSSKVTETKLSSPFVFNKD